jgi:hypothetical protein
MNGEVIVGIVAIVGTISGLYLALYFNDIVDRLYYKAKRRKAFKEWEESGAKNEND